MSSLRAILQALAAFGLAAPVFAAPVTIPAGMVTTRIRVARPARASAGATRAVTRRLADAALEACGGSGFSLAEMRAAVVATRCWQDAYADAIAQRDRGDGRGADASPMRGRP